MSQFILLAIGPVQEAISQARRTQDLLQGSRILSYLASIGVHYAQQSELARVLYPIIAPTQFDNTPNRMVVEWSGDPSKASVFAGEIETKIRQAWHKISQNTFDYFVQDFAPTPTFEAIWKRQEEAWLECYWVIAPNYTVATAQMVSRKLLRNFPQTAEAGRKCSITGKHEALHNDDDPSKFWQARKAEQRNLALLGQSERLCAISTIKRFAHEEDHGQPINPQLAVPHRFPSTSSMAAIPFKFDVLKLMAEASPDETHELLTVIKAFIAALAACFHRPEDLFFTKQGFYNLEWFPYLAKQIPTLALLFEGRQRISSQEEWVAQFLSIDGDFLFEDALISKTIEEYSQRPPSPQEMKRVTKALKNLIDTTQLFGIPKPQPYFAILSMDGDNMGDTLRSLESSEEHSRFSEALAAFAQQASQVVEQEYLGRLIYAGGDDVLALLPIRNALQVAEALRVTFAEEITQAKINRLDASASIGLVFVHHTHNLQDAIQAAQDAQNRIAKENYSRNAMGIELLRRSGEAREMGAKWMASKIPLVDRVIELVNAFSDGLSRSLPYDVSQISYSMGTETIPKEARLAEMGRILKRRLSQEKKDNVETLRDHIFVLGEDTSATLKKGWQNAQRWLELARFIAQKENDL